MIHRADLHTHSTASDGQYTPAELARLAKERGIQVWALTDHDNLDGLEEAAEAGQALGIQTVSGVELSADDYLNLHILGYAFPANSPALRKTTAESKAGRNKRKYRIHNFLRARGVEIPLEEVDKAAGAGAVGRPHFAQVMLQHGYVASRREAFDRYLDTPEFSEMEKGRKPSARTCVERIKNAGGKVALAHPYQIVLCGETLEELVLRLKDYGLDAIECYYPIHTPQQTADYIRIAKKNKLHITGGSDFHGEKNKPNHPLAAWELELDWLLA